MRHPRPKAPGGTENIFNIEPNMTREELSTLKTMPSNERVGTCWRLWSKDQMTKAEYEEVMAYRPEGAKTETQSANVVVPDDTVTWLSREFGATGHPNQLAGRSQKARLLELLKDGRWHSTREINERVYGSDLNNQSRAAARANELKNEGWDVNGSEGPEGTYGYRLNANERMI